MSGLKKILIGTLLALVLMGVRAATSIAQYSGYSQHGNTASNATSGMSAEKLLAQADQQVRNHDYAGAMSSYERAAAMGNVEAKRQVAVGYVRGVGTRQDVQKGMAMMEEIARTGDAKANYHLGYFYEKGEFVRRDYGRALQYFRISSKGGVWTSSFKLGVMYELGEGVAHDRKAAISWFERAASQRGDESAGYYAEFLRNAGSQRFTSGDEMASAYWAWFMKRYDSLLPKSNGNGTSNFNQRCLATAACANAVWPRN